MTCGKCGSQLKDGTTFCPYCGSKVEPLNSTPSSMQPPLSSSWSSPSASGVNGFYTPEKKHLTIGGWVLRYLINFIPCVGGIIFLIMLFVWSFDESYDDTSRNWAKANLIFIGICVALVLILYLIVVVAMGVTFDSLGRNGYSYTYY